MISKEALNDLWEYCVNWKDNPAKRYYNLINQDLDRLEQLKGIEEKLGIELDILFKALVQEEVYVKLSNGKIDKCAFIIEKLGENVFGFTYPIHEDFISYYLKDYGKTWALTREELVNEKK